MVITPPTTIAPTNSNNENENENDDASFSDSLIGRTMNKNTENSNEKSPVSTSSSNTQPTTLLSAFLKKTQMTTSQEYLRRSGSKRRASSEPKPSEDMDPWGWFEDFENPGANNGHTNERNGQSQSHFLQQPLQRSLSLPGPITQPPFYILESSLETQQLWYVTAGQRPKQPEKERKHFEELWTENFKLSSVLYTPPAAQSSSSSASTSSSSAFTKALSPSKTKQISGPDLVKIVTSVDLSATARGIVDRIPTSEFDGEVLFRGKGSFSNSVSKTFTDNAMTTITIQIPRFRVVKTRSGQVHAEFLNVVSLGSRNLVVLGVWRRHSEFAHLVSMVCISICIFLCCVYLSTCI